MQPFAPHSGESREWRVPGGGSSATRVFAASNPPRLGSTTFELHAQTVDECATARLELAVASRARGGQGASAAGAGAVLIRAETLASAQVDGSRVTASELARGEVALPATRNARGARAAMEALAAHVEAAQRALGLGAIAAAHTAPSVTKGRRRAASYRTTQTWIGGSDLWPTGADYVPPSAEHVPALMDDLVEFCARTDVDPVTQAAVAHAQFLSIQPFQDANGRAARALINGVWRRRGLTQELVVPISAAIAGDRRRYDSAWRAYREGDANPMVSLVARHTARSVNVAAASADRMALLPLAWAEAARPRRGSASKRLIGLLAAHPIVTAAEVMRLTGASQASAYDAIVRLADAGVLRRLNASKRGSVWVAGDVIDEAEWVVATLSGNGLPERRSPGDHTPRRRDLGQPASSPR